MESLQKGVQQLNHILSQPWKDDTIESVMHLSHAIWTGVNELSHPQLPIHLLKELFPSIERIRALQAGIHVSGEYAKVQQIDSAVEQLTALLEQQFKLCRSDLQSSLGREQWRADYLPVMTKELLAICSPDLVFELIDLALLSQEEITALCPSYAMVYTNVMQNKALSPRQKADRIEETYAYDPILSAIALAHVIDNTQMSLCDAYIRESPISTRELEDKLQRIAPYVRYLNCTDLTIYALPSCCLRCEKFICRNCPHISCYPELPMCTYVLLQDCASLTKGPEKLSRCTIFDIFNCPESVVLPHLPLVEHVRSVNCSKLGCERGAFPCLKTWDWEGSPLLQQHLAMMPSDVLLFPKPHRRVLRELRADFEDLNTSSASEEKVVKTMVKFARSVEYLLHEGISEENISSLKPMIQALEKYTTRSWKNAVCRDAACVAMHHVTSAITRNTIISSS